MKKLLLVFLLNTLLFSFILMAQNVDIGTSTPSYKLHVETTGTAIYGNSTGTGYGVYGNSTYLGVYGAGGPYGVYGNGTSYGVYGITGSGKAVYGSSSSGYGVYGTGGPYGVYGYGTSYGVWGVSSYLGVYGDGTNYGVYGSSYSGEGVRGISTYSTGVYGYSSNYHGGHFILVITTLCGLQQVTAHRTYTTVTCIRCRWMEIIITGLKCLI